MNYIWFYSRIINKNNKNRCIGMKERRKFLFKNMGILTISNFSSKILVFLLVPLYTSVLSTTEYGTYDFIISTVGLLYPILTLNIADAVMRFTMDETYSSKKVISVGIKYVSISFIIMTMFILCGLHVMKIRNRLLIFSCCITFRMCLINF